MESLPDEIVVNIMQYLPVEDLVTLSSVSKRYHTIANEESIWKGYLYRDFEYDDEDYDYFHDTFEEETRRLCYIDKYTRINSNYIRNLTDLTENIRRYPRVTYSEYSSLFSEQKMLSKRMVRFIRENVIERMWGIGDVCFHTGSFTFDGITYEYRYSNCISDDINYVRFSIKH